MLCINYVKQYSLKIKGRAGDMVHLVKWTNMRKCLGLITQNPCKKKKQAQWHIHVIPVEVERERSMGLTASQLNVISEFQANERPCLCKQGKWHQRKNSQNCPLAFTDIHTHVFTYMCSYIYMCSPIYILMCTPEISTHVRKSRKSTPSVFFLNGFLKLNFQVIVSAWKWFSGIGKSWQEIDLHPGKLYFSRNSLYKLLIVLHKLHSHLQDVWPAKLCVGTHHKAITIIGSTMVGNTV